MHYRIQRGAKTAEGQTTKILVNYDLSDKWNCEIYQTNLSGSVIHFEIFLGVFVFPDIVGKCPQTFIKVLIPKMKFCENNLKVFLDRPSLWYL